MLTNIPAELKTLRQWVNWRYDVVDGKTTKVPYNANTGHKASVTDPSTWATFDRAVGQANKFEGIGFVLSKDDPFCIIDLDNKPSNPASEEQLARHTKIYETFQSYTETSISGTGVHIIVRGTIPAGVNRDHVEVYSSDRYMVCTGNVLRDLPILDFQETLDVLYGEMKTPDAESIELIDRESLLTDQELVDMAMNAVNGEKFNSLCAGNIEGYIGPSEADLALLSIIAYYSPDNKQVRRIFRMSALGKRAKATKNDTYLNFTLQHIRAQQPAPIDEEQMRANAAILMAPKPPAAPEPEIKSETVIPVSAPASHLSLPPGLVGELAQYFYQTAVRPVQEIALTAAIAMVAGIAGRSYNISGTGLNQYLVLLARTGSGKEGAAGGIEKLFAAVRPSIPMIDEFIGPAAFASGQALAKRLTERPCFVSVLGEFGLTLQQISDVRANSAEKMLKKVLLDIYGKSGHHRVLQSSVYSDVEKNTAAVRAPNVTILGESTPESFYDGLNASHVAEGLIPRFCIVEYKGGRPPRNPHADIPPPPPLIQRFSDLAISCITMNNNNACCQVEMDGDADRMMGEFDLLADRHMAANSGDEVELQLWNRAHVKALKLGALLAVGINPHKPVITKQSADWAIAFVTADIQGVHSRFAKGDVGQGDSKQFADLKAAIEAFFKLDKKTMDGYGIPSNLVEAKIVPYKYVIRRTASMSSFRLDKLGATASLKKALQVLIDSGMLVEVPKQILHAKYQFSGMAYAIGNNWQ